MYTMTYDVLITYTVYAYPSSLLTHSILCTFLP